MILNPLRWSDGRFRLLMALGLTVGLAVSYASWWPLAGLCVVYLWFASENGKPSIYAGLDVADVISLSRKEHRLYLSRKAEFEDGDLNEAAYWRRRAEDDY